MGFGYWITFTKSPDSYMPRDSHDPSMASDASEHTLVADEEGEDDAEASVDEVWTIRLTGIVEGVTVLGDDEGEQFFGIQVAYDDDVEAVGEAPEISSPILTIGAKTLVESTLGKSPEIGEKVAVQSRGTDDNPRSLAIQEIELVD